MPQTLKDFLSLIKLFLTHTFWRWRPGTMTVRISAIELCLYLWESDNGECVTLSLGKINSIFTAGTRSTWNICSNFTTLLKRHVYHVRGLGSVSALSWLCDDRRSEDEDEQHAHVSLLRLLFFAVVTQRKLAVLLLCVVAFPVHHTLLVDDRLQHTQLSKRTCASL